MKTILGPLALCVVLASTVAALAQADPLANTADDVVKTLPRTNAEEAPLPQAVIEFPTQQAPANSGTFSFVLSDIAIEGPEVVPRESLRPLYADLVGKQITLLQAFDVLAQIQAAHRDAGYVFTRVVAPPQEINGGIFTVQVVEAFIGDVVIEEPEGTVGPPLPLIDKIAGQLEGVKNPTLAQLERVLLLINDVPGIIQATAVPRSGTGLGAVDLYINVVRDPFSGVFFADNRQSPILGPLILGVSLEASSWSSAGDTTTLSFFNTAGPNLPDDLTERNIVQLEHQRNIGSNGTTVKVRGLASINEPGNTLEALDISGEQFNFETTIEHPFVRTRPFSLWLNAGFEVEENDVETQDGAATIVDDSLRVAYIGARILQRDDFGFTRADIQLRQGLGIFGASDPGENNLSRFDGKAEFTSLQGSVDREVVFPFAGRKISVFASALGQISSDPLLSSEEFAVGGQLIGRAYDPSEFTGDSGVGALGELRYQTDFEVVGAQIGAQFYGYADIAEVYNRGDAIGSENLQSYGGGVRVSLPQDLSISGEVAVPKQRLQRNNERKPRFFFNLVKRF